MPAYVLSPAARKDLSGIWRYTATNWDAAQADRYVRDIDACFVALSSGEKRGRSIENVQPNFFKVAVHSHFVIYRMTPAGDFDIVRILHKRMDIVSRLP